MNLDGLDFNDKRLKFFYQRIEKRNGHIAIHNQLINDCLLPENLSFRYSHEFGMCEYHFSIYITRAEYGVPQNRRYAIHVSEGNSHTMCIRGNISEILDFKKMMMLILSEIDHYVFFGTLDFLKVPVESGYFLQDFLKTADNKG